MTNKRWFLRAGSILLAAMFAAGTGCGDEPERQPKLSVEVIGWGPDDQGDVGFHRELPAFAGAAEVRASLLQPGTNTLVEQRSFTPAQGGAKLPELRFGSGYRLDFELLNSQSTPVAAGATPIFDFGEDEVALSFRIQVGQVNAFAPVGSDVVRDGERELVQSRMDYRRLRANGAGDDSWLGRVGHVTVPFDGGNKALTVGGGYSETSTTPRPGSLPEFTTIHDDLMEFDPVSGYFTDLAYDEQTGAERPNGADRLLEPRAYHTVTPIGGDRFLVVGGLTPNDPNPRALRSIELIDLNAQPGTRVQQLEDSSGVAAQLNDARAYHTATYRPIDNTVVVTGGISGGADDVLASVEIIDLDNGEVTLGPDMNDARAEHEAVVMGSGETIWLLGGRDASGALASTDALTLSDGTNLVSEEATMKTARFGFSAMRITPNDRNVVVIGGYTDLEGGATDTYEMSSLGREGEEFKSEGNWRLKEARAYPAAFELPETSNIVVLGGRDDNATRVGQAEVLEYGDIANPKPYTSELTEGSTYNERAEFSATRLSNGKILLIGGIGRRSGRTTALDDAEYFTPFDASTASSTEE
ncbi:MAG: kelch repeat-containing protein [Persicimonas sp.]